MKRLASFIITLLIAALLPWTAVQAAEQENVVLTGEDGKVKIELRLPDDSQEVSTLKLRLKVTGNTDKLDQSEPFAFKAGEDITSSRLLETRFQIQEETVYFTIYISNTGKITDKSDFELGTIIPNSIDDSEYELRFSVSEGGLEFVDESGTVEEPAGSVSSPVAVKVNAVSETPDDNTDEKPDDNTGGTPDEDQDDTLDGDQDDTLGGDQDDTPEGGQGDTSDTESDQKPAGTPSGSEGGQNQAVDTGDHSNILLYLVLAGISAAGIGVGVVLRRNGQ